MDPPPSEDDIISKVRDAFLFIPSQTLKAVNQGIFASGGAGQSSGEVTTTQKIAVAALAVALLIADQLGSSRYVISHAVEAVYGGLTSSSRAHPLPPTTRSTRRRSPPAASRL